MTTELLSGAVLTGEKSGMPEQRTPIRILELRAADGPGGGPEKTILNGARLSDPLDFDIRVVYLRDHNDQCRELSDRAKDLRLSYHEIRTGGPFDRSVCYQLYRMMGDAHPSIIHTHDYKSSLIAWMVARKFKAKLLATAHGWTGNHFKERLIYYPAERFILKRFHHIVSVSSQITEQLVSSGVRPQLISTIPNGIDAFRFVADPVLRAKERVKLAPGPVRFIIGGVGRLEKQKRFDLLIDAFATIRGEYADSVLLIAGDGTLKSQLQQQIDRLGISGCCRLVGHVANISSFYHALDLFVQSSDYEGTPNVVLEAMAMRVPVVVTDAGGTRDIIADRTDGLIVATGSVQGLAQAITESLSNEVESRLRADRARSKVENELSFLSRNRKLENIYRSMVNPKSENAIL